MPEEHLSQDTRNILGLQLPTDPRWVDLAGKSMQEILTDHAYCEQKAATSCISLIQRYSERKKLVKELSVHNKHDPSVYLPGKGLPGLPIADQ